MNKKQLEEIIKDSVVFTIHTRNGFVSEELNRDKINFRKENMLEITKKHGVFQYISIDDIDVVTIMR